MMADLLLKAQLHKDKNAVVEILDSFTPKINASLRQVPPDHREDLRQELYLSMIEVIHRFDLN
ncbi:helix-turn-helix domain-containing protein [Paenibacillus campinasensis]|uniref:Helix-turn-helix conjugative transposon-like domain-containing protein n=1 Tax=Paenibacillus campinasensis TaxID=66347 RepID=A0A268EIB9_9BACL|nr:helix-turn-helix domain-containing protein [Paenibacillus campinasensis]PAD72814.1 hypothetical protein CHH67_21130 [Paenibacillus campinasensis]